MISNLAPGQIPAVHLTNTARLIAEELDRVRLYLQTLELAQQDITQPLNGPPELEVVIPEEGPNDIRGWAAGTDLARTYQKAVHASGGRRGRPHVFLNLGPHSIAISPADMEDESRMQFGQYTERHDFSGTVVWSKSNRGKVWLLRPEGS